MPNPELFAAASLAVGFSFLSVHFSMKETRDKFMSLAFASMFLFFAVYFSVL